MFRFIFQSLIIKTVLFFAVVIIAVNEGLNFIFEKGGSSLSLYVVIITILIVLSLALLMFIWRIYLPLTRVTDQIKLLLSGKTFKRIPAKTIDEIGVITHFFNEITRDLEKISYDVKERRRMSSELSLASGIQKDVLPKEAPDALGLDIVAKTRSAAEVGGDTFGFLTSTDGRSLFVYIGDVTGHGVPAGLVMMMVDTLMNAMVYRGVNNGRDLVANTNKLLAPRISSRLFMTSVVLRWDQEAQKMHYTGAGHEHVLVYRLKDESVEPIPSGGIALGMIPDVGKIVQEKEIPMEIGDAIVLYSDGITEARNVTGQMFGLENLAKSLQRHGYRPSAESILDNLTRDFSDFVQEYVQADDITMIVIKHVGKGVAPSKVKLTIAQDSDRSKAQNKKWNWTD